MKKYILGLFCLIAVYAVENQSTVATVKGMRFPSISPQGNSIAFVYKSDIWISATNGENAKRITLHPDDDTRPIWSPDGKWLIFSSNRSGNFDVWIISSGGGKARQVTWNSTWDLAYTCSPDGKYIYFSSYRSGTANVWKVPFTGGLEQQVTFDSNCAYPSFSQDGSILVYARGSLTLWQKGYKGSSNWDLFVQKGSSLPKKVTKYEGNEIQPIIAGDFIYYLRETSSQQHQEENLVYNIWKMKIGEYKPIKVTSLPQDIDSFDVDKSGKFAIIEMNFTLWKLPLDVAKPQKISLQIPQIPSKDVVENVIVDSGNEMGHWSPDGNQITFILNGDIYTMSAVGGKIKRITETEEKEQWPRFSPDGKQIAYCVDQDGDSNIFVINLSTEEEKQITTHPSNDFYHSWSPDGKNLLFTSERSGNRDIWLISVKTGTSRQITHSNQAEDDAVYSPDGRWIAFDSAKSGSQEIWVMPADGKYEDARQITSHKKLTQVATWSADSNWIVYETNDDGNASIRMVSRNGGESMLVESNASVPCWSPDGSKILFESRKEGRANLYQIEAPKKVVTSTRIPFILETQKSKMKEKKQVFKEAWEYIDKLFYDADFHGKDWKKIGDQYRDITVNSATDYEMNFYMNRMLGELEASHLGITQKKENLLKTGYLGWRLREIPGKRGLQIVNVLKDGPADKQWVREGDIVFQMKDKILTKTTNLSKLLNGTVGKKVRVFVSPSYDVTKGRYLDLVPVSLAKIRSFQYNALLRKRMSLVREKCQGKVLYLHLRDMGANTLRDFREVMQKYSAPAKGMILDLRDNVGGFIHQDLLNILSQKAYITNQSRGSKIQYQPSVHWGKPIVVLINENSYSDAEVFTHAFKEMGLGEVVGVPTSGGVIGTRDITLSNGSSFRIPAIGYYTIEGKNLEGNGVTPNHLVRETYEDRLKNRDPQLKLAIKLILQKLEGKNK